MVTRCGREQPEVGRNEAVLGPAEAFVNSVGTGGAWARLKGNGDKTAN